MFKRHLQFTQRIGDLRAEGAVCTAIGCALDSLGRYADALEWHERRLKIAQKMEDEEGEKISVQNLLRASTMLLQIAVEDGDVVSECHALSDICLMHRAIGDDMAADTYDRRREQVCAIFMKQAAVAATAAAIAAADAAKIAVDSVEPFETAAPTVVTVPAPAAPAAAPAAPVREWLLSVNGNLASLYSEPFAEYGFEDTDLLMSAKEDQLEEAFEVLAVKKPHRHRIMGALHALKLGPTRALKLDPTRSSKSKGAGYQPL
jgi:hypothetical protein